MGVQAPDLFYLSIEEALKDDTQGCSHGCVLLLLLLNNLTELAFQHVIVQILARPVISLLLAQVLSKVHHLYELPEQQW